MSSASISGGGQSIFDYLQSLRGSQQASQTSSTSSTDPSTATTSTSATTTTDPDGDSNGSSHKVGGHHHHHGGGGGGAFFKQVQSAVTSALQDAQSSGSDSDPNSVIQTAIAQVLKNHQNGSASSTTGDSATGASDTDGSSGGATGSTSGADSKSAFAQLLQSNGIDPQQFHQDFAAAIQAAQTGGSTDPSSVFSSFPTGSAVDTVA